MDEKDNIKVLCSKLFQSYDATADKKVKLSSERVDELRQLISKSSNGLNVNYLESSHQIPKFKKLYSCGEVIDNVDDIDHKLIFLSDKPKQKSILLEKSHNRKDLFVADWDEEVLVKVSLDDSVCNRAHIFLDRFPQRQHSFVGLAQTDNLYNNQKGRQKIIDFATRGFTLYSPKSRSHKLCPNGGLQHYFGYHNTYRRFEDSYATCKCNDINVSIL